jgi:hypothetical protein
MEIQDPYKKAHVLLVNSILAPGLIKLQISATILQFHP